MATFVYSACEVLMEDWGVPEHQVYTFLHERGLVHRKVRVMPLFSVLLPMCHAAE